MTQQASDSSVDESPRVGSTVGKYHILRALGRGGMGVVYEAEDTALKRRVAIKFLPQASVGDAKAVERFVQEAQAAAKLNHPNIIAIHDIGHDAGAAYMVMELLNARSLGGYLRDQGPLPWADATAILVDCCSALEAAHAAGLVHRDIKPENILLTQDGRAKLVDFGLVKDLSNEGQHLTQTGALIGTPLYMSPEQGAGKAIDGRSDLYSLGTAYYALLTGKPPFSGPTPHILFQHYMEPMPDPRLAVPTIPEACVRILMRATQKDPAARYQTAAELRADAEAAIAGVARSGIVATSSPAAPAANRHSGTSPTAASSGGPVSAAGATAARTPLPRHSVSRWLVVPVLVLGLAALRWGWLGRPPGAQTPPVAAVQKDAPIQVGVLHSLTGSLASVERPIVDATLLAIEELNEHGGVLGRRVEAIVLDGKSDNRADGAFCLGAKQLIEQDHVAALFGTWTSATRKAIKPLIERAGQLLIYPAQYEGLEDSEAILYVGATPNQQVIPTVRHVVEKLGHRKLFLVGSDGIYSHVVHALITEEVKRLGAEVVGQQYFNIGETNFSAVIKAIAHCKPDLVLNTLRGDSSAALVRTLRDGNRRALAAPMVSFGLGEGEQQQLADFNLEGDLLGASYASSVETPENRAFVDRFRKKFGAHRSPDESAEAAYVGVMLWAQAARAAQSEAPRRVRQALGGQTFPGPEGPVQVDPSTHHVFKRFRLARFAKGNRLDMVASSEAPLPPLPFPGPRLRVEWESFLEQRHLKWQGNWANPSPPSDPSQ